MNFASLKAYALNKKVPIITDEVFEFLRDLIQKHHIEHVLEIGTAIGYSALAMASFGCKVKTFERDEFMIDEAKRHFDLFEEGKLVTLFPFDALTYDEDLGQFDLIFIDAAKSQYETFFKKYEKHLKVGGFIVCDNLHFHNLDPNKVNRHTKALLGKLVKFKQFLIDNTSYKTEFYDLGDGVSISMRMT